jgi:hypothetical protein
MDTACTCGLRILLQPLLAQILQKIYKFETTVRQNRKTVAARDVCVSLRVQFVVEMDHRQGLLLTLYTKYL